MPTVASPRCCGNGRATSRLPAPCCCNTPAAAHRGTPRSGTGLRSRSTRPRQLARGLSQNAVRAELDRAVHQAGLDHIIPHQLRHTYATALVSAGVSLQALMETELLERHHFATHAQAKAPCFHFIEGPCRRHSTLGMLSPAEYERRHGPNKTATLPYSRKPRCVHTTGATSPRSMSRVTDSPRGRRWCAVSTLLSPSAVPSTVLTVCHAREMRCLEASAAEGTSGSAVPRVMGLALGPGRNYPLLRDVSDVISLHTQASRGRTSDYNEA
ncbi:tyrosine-type recombinase/integrase [Microbispora rosea]